MPKNNLTKNAVINKLKKVIDPELGISIVDLGFIYNIKIEKGIVNIKMTLTTIGCPLWPIIENDVKVKVKSIKGVKKVNVELTFDPPWSIDRMSDAAKAKLGI